MLPTEQKRAESQAIEAVRQRDRFLAMLSHELRNPLGAILNAACVVKRLQQVQINLLMNAVKFTPAGGQIRLRLCREKDAAVLSVRDDGQGISSDMLERVFDLFVQADTTLHHQQGGLGIGLTLVRMLVEMHGGTVIEGHDVQLQPR